MNLSCITFNCCGFKGSNSFIQKLSNDYDISFICEHWMTPADIQIVQSSLQDDEKYVFFKSSMDPEMVQAGRGYGGIGFICKEFNGISYRPVNIENDRISAVVLVKDKVPLLYIIGVYMPYFSGSSEQSQLYAETLDILQETINNCILQAPVMIVGDFNASLPRCRTDLTSNWSRVRPFNRNSQMLLDWIDDNQLEISNFNFSQSVNYTYVKGTHKTYIDHILASEQANQWITDCTIISNDPECTSDHFPVKVKLKIPACSINKSKTPSSEVYNVKVKSLPWHNRDFISHYKNKIKVVFDELVTSDEIVGPNNAQSYVDGYCSDITSSIH